MKSEFIHPKSSDGISDNPYCNDFNCNEENSRANLWHNELIKLWNNELSELKENELKSAYELTESTFTASKAKAATESAKRQQFQKEIESHLLAIKGSANAGNNQMWLQKPNEEVIKGLESLGYVVQIFNNQYGQPVMKVSW